MTRSGVSRATPWPMPSRTTLPPPKRASSPYTLRSASTSSQRSVSARRMRSPVVGPKCATYARRSCSTGMSVQGSVQQTVEAAHDASASEGHQPHGALLAWFEANRRSRRNVEAEAARRFTGEVQRAIDLEKMEVRTDLDRPVAGVGHINMHC